MRPRYIPVRFLAAGGMAEVILARQVVDSGIERTVVVKQVLKHLAGEREFVEMFASEMRLAVQLRHPNIVQVLDAGDNDGVPFLAMEALFGADLRTLLRESIERGVRPPIDAVLSIAADVARGLHYAHTLAGPDGRSLGVVHRDISPHNVFITRDGTAKILDFGIAKSAAQMTATTTGITKGKPGYMAPEQIRGDALDARTDVYALGVVLWESLLRKRLWKRESDVASSMATLMTDPVPPSSLADDIPPALDALVVAMLARDPSRRPMNADAVAHAIDRILEMRGCRSPRSAVAEFVRTLLPERADDFDSSATVPAIGDFGGAEGADLDAASPVSIPPSPSATRLAREIASPRERPRSGVLLASGVAVAIVAFSSALWVTKFLRASNGAEPARAAPVRAAAPSPAVNTAARATPEPPTAAPIDAPAARPIVWPDAPPADRRVESPSISDAGRPERTPRHPPRPTVGAGHGSHGPRVLPVGATYRE